MSRSSDTVGSNAFLLGQLRGEVNELKALFMDALRQMLLISQVQAENTRELTRALQMMVNVPNVEGGGSTRNQTEEDELRQWRDETRQAATGERPDRTIGATMTDPANDW